MKKKISNGLTLGKRSVATLSGDSMAQVNGGGYTSAGCAPGVGCNGAGSGGNGVSDLSLCYTNTGNITGIYCGQSTPQYCGASTFPGNVGCR